jgi:hypothetical protein
LLYNHKRTGVWKPWVVSVFCTVCMLPVRTLEVLRDLCTHVSAPQAHNVVLTAFRLCCQCASWSIQFLLSSYGTGFLSFNCVYEFHICEYLVFSHFLLFVGVVLGMRPTFSKTSSADSGASFCCTSHVSNTVPSNILPNNLSL